MRHHGEADIDHGAELFDLTQSLPLSDDHLALIGVAAQQTVERLTIGFD